MKLYLTYFTNSTKDELEDVIKDLSTILPRDEIVNLFVEHFDADSIFTHYGVDITSKLEASVKKTLEYAIDTEALIYFIDDVIDRSNET